MSQDTISAKSRNKIRIGSLTFDVALIILLLLFCVVILYPFLHVIAVSLSFSRMITRGAVGLIPQELNV